MNEIPLNKAKELCELGICCSMAHARRVVATLDPKRIEKLIELNKLEKIAGRNKGDKILQENKR